MLAPMVFTSALALEDLYEPAVREQFGEPVWSISQAPQVSLDAQIMEYSGGILLNWDVRDDVFIEGVVAAMFGYFRGQLERLLEAPEYWHLPLQTLTPVMPIEPRQVCQPQIARAFARAAQSPDTVALLWGDQGDAMSSEEGPPGQASTDLIIDAEAGTHLSGQDNVGTSLNEMADGADDRAPRAAHRIRRATRGNPLGKRARGAFGECYPRSGARVVALRGRRGPAGGAGLIS